MTIEQVVQKYTGQYLSKNLAKKLVSELENAVLEKTNEDVVVSKQQSKTGKNKAFVATPPEQKVTKRKGSAFIATEDGVAKS